MDGVTFGTHVLLAVFTETLDLDIFPSGLVTRLTVGVVVLVTDSVSRDKAVGHSKKKILNIDRTFSSYNSYRSRGRVLFVKLFAIL